MNDLELLIPAGTSVIAAWPGSFKCLGSPQEKMFSLTDSSSEKCAVPSV